MPVAALARVNPADLYPPYLQRWLLVVAECERRGSVYAATRGYASFADQHAIYLRGRTVSSYVEVSPAHPLGLPVTHADAGDSDHNYGLALDAVHDSDDDGGNGVSYDWTDGKYNVLGEELLLAGLDWGAPYHDKPHGAWPGYVTGTDLAPLKRLYLAVPGTDADLVVRAAKLRAVWTYLDAECRALPAYPAPRPVQVPAGLLPAPVLANLSALPAPAPGPGLDPLAPRLARKRPKP